jgi:hypothetical protein
VSGFIFLKYLEPLSKNIMQAGLVYIAGTAGQLVVNQAISPIVASTISLLTSLRSSNKIVTLQQIIDKHDITCTLQTIEATCVALECNKEPLKTASKNVVIAVQQIHQLLTRIADITASHNAGYISRWRLLNLEYEIQQLEAFMEVLSHRFKLMCNIRSVVI